MPMANLAHGELTDALNRGWEGRDSRVAMTLQKERAGVKIKVDPGGHQGRDRARRETIKQPARRQSCT